MSSVVDKDHNAMPYWYYDKKDLQNTPSYQDGIEYETESRYRKEGARFIIDTGTKMDLGYNTMATGVVYFHRFYMFHSFRTFPRYVTACCCLFLAGKVEETPKKCKDIIKQAKALLTDQKFGTFGEDPKEEVMTLERILLQTIKFDLQVEHPYSYLLKYAKCLKGDKNKLQKMVQMAWTFVNDSLCTTLSLQWEPEVIAVALMFLAGKLSKFEIVDWNGRLPKHNAWWDMFVEDITTELLEDICHQVLDLYSPQPQQTGVDSPPIASSNAAKAEKKSATTSPSTPATVQSSKPVTSLKNGSESKADISMGQPIKSLGTDTRYSYPSTYGAIPTYPPSYTTPLRTPPPSLMSLPRAPVFSEPPPHFPSSVSIPPPNYFPPALPVPTRPPYYQPPPQ